MSFPSIPNMDILHSKPTSSHAERAARIVETHHHTVMMGLAFWPLIGVVLILSILVGVPTFACIVFHMRRAKDVETRVIRKISGTKAPTDYELYHKNHSGAHYYADSPDSPRQPRRVTSSGSNFPLLRLSPERSRNNSRNPSSSHPQPPQASERNLNANFAQNDGTVSSVAYPRPVHHARGGRLGYGTLGSIVDSTYTAAQRMYRGRHRLNFWSSWVPPWARKGGLERIDEENDGSRRLPKVRSINTNQRRKSAEVSNLDVPATNESMRTQRSETTMTSGFSVRGTPPTFQRVNEYDGYNPEMARALTRRLLKYGFAPKDGVQTSENKSMTAPVRIASGPWKGRAELKKRATERRRIESGSGARLFSFQRKQKEGDEEPEDEYDENADDEAEDPFPEQNLERTSIRDFAHAFHQNITPVKVEEASSAGTIRRHRIDDEDDRDSISGRQSTMSPTTQMSPVTEVPPTASREVTSSSEKDKDKDMDVDAGNLKENMETPVQTIRGRRRIRDPADTPETQKKRMERNTPKSTLSRESGVSLLASDKTKQQRGGTGTPNQEEFVDITKELLGYSPQKSSD